MNGTQSPLWLGILYEMGWTKAREAVERIRSIGDSGTFESIGFQAISIAMSWVRSARSSIGSQARSSSLSIPSCVMKEVVTFGSINCELIQNDRKHVFLNSILTANHWSEYKHRNVTCVNQHQVNTFQRVNSSVPEEVNQSTKRK